MVTIPPFSSPKTRTEYDRIISQLADSFTKQGLPDGRTLAALTVNLRDQGLSDSQILKQIETHLAKAKAKADAKAAEVAKLQAEQKPLLDKLAAEKAAREKAAEEKRIAQQRAVVPNLGKPEPMVANPDNPRGPLIPKSQAGAIIEKRRQQGKDTPQTSGTQDIEALRAKNAAEKAGISNPVPVAVNRSSVLLSNGQIVNRATFKGTIPAELLANQQVQEQFPKSFNSQTDLPKASTPASAKPQTSATEKVDPLKQKEGSGKFGSKSAFSQPPPKPEETLGGLLQSASDTITGALSGKSAEEVKTEREEQKAEPKQEQKPFDLFGSLKQIVDDALKSTADALGGAGKTITDSVAAVTNPPAQQPKTEVKSEPEKTPTATETEKIPTTPTPPNTEFPVHGDGDPTKPEKKSLLDTAKETFEKHGTAIIVGFAAVSFISALMFTARPARQAVMKNK